MIKSRRMGVLASSLLQRSQHQLQQQQQQQQHHYNHHLLLNSAARNIQTPLIRWFGSDITTTTTAAITGPVGINNGGGANDKQEKETIIVGATTTKITTKITTKNNNHGENHHRRPVHRKKRRSLSSTPRHRRPSTLDRLRTRNFNHPGGRGRERLFDEELIVERLVTRLEWMRKTISLLWKEDADTAAGAGAPKPRPMRYELKMNANWWFWNLLLAITPGTLIGLYCEFVAKRQMEDAYGKKIIPEMPPSAYSPSHIWSIFISWMSGQTVDSVDVNVLKSAKAIPPPSPSPSPPPTSHSSELDQSTLQKLQEMKQQIEALERQLLVPSNSQEQQQKQQDNRYIPVNERISPMQQRRLDREKESQAKEEEAKKLKLLNPDGPQEKPSSKNAWEMFADITTNSYKMIKEAIGDTPPMREENDKDPENSRNTLDPDGKQEKASSLTDATATAPETAPSTIAFAWKTLADITSNSYKMIKEAIGDTPPIQEENEKDPENSRNPMDPECKLEDAAATAPETAPSTRTLAWKTLAGITSNSYKMVTPNQEENNKDPTNSRNTMDPDGQQKEDSSLTDAAATAPETAPSTMILAWKTLAGISTNSYKIAKEAIWVSPIQEEENKDPTNSRNTLDPDGQQDKASSQTDAAATAPETAPSTMTLAWNALAGITTNSYKVIKEAIGVTPIQEDNEKDKNVEEPKATSPRNSSPITQRSDKNEQ